MGLSKEMADYLSNKVAVEDLYMTIIIARYSVKDWSIRSELNANMTKGWAFNMFTETKNSIIIHKRNLLVEFGEYLPNLNRYVEKRFAGVTTIHEEPRDLNFSILVKVRPIMVKIR